MRLKISVALILFAGVSGLIASYLLWHGLNNPGYIGVIPNLISLLGLSYAGLAYISSKGAVDLVLGD